MTFSEKDLDHRLSQLTRDEMPGEYNWQQISQRLNQRRPYATLAAVATLAAIVILATLVIQLPDDSGWRNPLAVVAMAEMEVMRHHAPQELPEETEPGWDEAWQANQQAIDELEQALKRHPDNPLLIEFLARSRLRQASLINQTMTDEIVVADNRS